jgi:hypothetical protein
MPSKSMMIRIIRVRIVENEAGLLLATSPDLSGLLVIRRTMDDLHWAIRCCIRQLYASCGVNVVAARLEGSEDGFTPWVATPMEVVERAIELTAGGWGKN